MSATALPPVTLTGSPRATGTAASFVSSRTGRQILAQVLFCALPTAILLAVGRAEWGGRVFWILFSLVFARLLVVGRTDELLCVLLALAPFLNLLRQFVIYNIVAALFLMGVLYYAARTPAPIRALPRRYPLIVPLLGFAAFYYALSFALTGDYSVNLRLVDLALAAVAILVVGRDPTLLGSALTGLVLSADAIGLAMLPHLESDASDRLGMVVIEGIWMGNPVQLGLPLALALLALTVDGGRWVSIKSRWARFALVLLTLFLLALTTSRAAWLVAACGALVLFLFGRRHRLKIIGIALVVWLAVQLILLSPYRQGLQSGIDRTFSEERTARNRTSGRSDQWRVAYYAFTKSVGSLTHGYGPGLGPKVYASASEKVPGIEFLVGREVGLHSLYMQVMVEAGLLGLVPLALWMGVGLFRSFVWTRRRGVMFPLVCFCGYILVAVTVSGNDTTSGSLLGMGLLSTIRRSRSAAAKTFPRAHGLRAGRAPATAEVGTGE